MAVDIGELVDSLKRELNPPGQDLFPAAEEDEWIGRLTDALYEAQLAGMLAGYLVNDNDEIVSPVGVADMPRVSQQLLVLYAGMRATITELRNTKATVRSKAGPVEFEVQRSAQLLMAVLKEIKSKIDLAIVRLSDAGGTTVAVFDAVVENSYNIWYSENIGFASPWWVR